MDFSPSLIVSGFVVVGPGEASARLEILTQLASQTGLVPFKGDDVPVGREIPNAPRLKRKLKETEFEIADSEDDYGWDSDDDRHLPPEPPQWQGSEDLIVGTQKYKSDDEDGPEEGVDGDEEKPDEESEPPAYDGDSG
jgi:hypothetical protein